MSAKYQDAVGYLREYAESIRESWFTLVCDIVTLTGIDAYGKDWQRGLRALFVDRATYLRPQFCYPSSAAQPSCSPHGTTDFLESLSGFSNFKKLEPTLSISFDKRLSIVFGANGSGKSSLCEALKAIATPESPHRPLEDVRTASASSPKFMYKFSNDNSNQVWTESAGYGMRGSTLKYFDATIAHKNIRRSIEPEKIVSVAPFNLGVFEDTTTLTNIFRNEIQEEINELTNDLAKTLASIKSFFKDFSNYPLSQVGEDQIDFITSAIEAVNTFSQESLTENINLAKNIEKALSSEGLRLLIVEKQELKLLIKSINRLLINCNTFFKLDSPQKSEDLNNKIKMQEILAEAVIPKDSNAEYFLSFLRATTSVCDFSSLEEPSCPLCKRPLGKEEVKLFNQYHKLISSQIEKDIATLQQEITTAKKILAQIHKTVPGEWDNYSTLPKEMLNQGKLYANAIIEDCKIANKHSAATEEHIKQLKALCLSGASQVLQKKQAIDLASKDRPSLERQLNKVNAEIEALMYAQLIQNKIDLLYRAKYLDAEISLLKSKLPSFTRLLRGITYSAKNAFEDLVVSDFEHRLNKEYLALAEQDISAFGVTLASRGSDAAVTVLPQIGGKEIENILSEGEQRLHSLALFFAETETSEHSVLVFDDPISSFDYKFTENYCIRLRDLALKHPDRQLIVLTHDWYFFIALQTKLNRANLNNDLSIYVLENCSHLGEYSEKIDDLKANILAILTSHGEPNNSEKETLAGNMRRLIESIINTHVFNKLRHQYRAKSQTVSAFGPYTKLVPLLEQEAHDLQDLYGKLSISAHDDPRNAYVNTNKATFQTRYDKIVDIESAIIGRK